MVYVRLAKDWTDSSGNAHSAGEMVDVDAGTLATLEANGTVAEASPDAGWVGPSGGSTDAGWVGPSSDDDN
jgi:hypothetical protein